MTTRINLNTPIARRAALSDRIEQLKRMMEIRTVEDRIQKLFADGMVRGSTHLCNGQEAVSVGVARATEPDDVITCTYRGHGHALALGATPVQVLGEICGRMVGCAVASAVRCISWRHPSGCCRRSRSSAPGCRSPAALRWRRATCGTDRVAVTMFGDGSTNIGAFHESLNFAAIRKLPVDLHLREQPLRRIHPHQPEHAHRRHRRARYRIRHAERNRRRPGRGRGRRGDRATRSSGPAGATAHR